MQEKYLSVLQGLNEEKKYIFLFLDGFKVMIMNESGEKSSNHKNYQFPTGTVPI